MTTRCDDIRCHAGRLHDARRPDTRRQDGPGHGRTRATAIRHVSGRPAMHPPITKRTSRMLLHEELARDRIRELRLLTEGGAQQRRKRAVRRWNRIARWASRRAAHLER